MCYWGKTADTSLVEEIHDKGFDSVVVIVSESDFVAVERHSFIVQSTASQVRAKTARMLFFADIKHYAADLSNYDLMLYA